MLKESGSLYTRLCSIGYNLEGRSPYEGYYQKLIFYKSLSLVSGNQGKKTKRNHLILWRQQNKASMHVQMCSRPHKAWKSICSRCFLPTWVSHAATSPDSTSYHHHCYLNATFFYLFICVLVFNGNIYFYFSSVFTRYSI